MVMGSNDYLGSISDRFTVGDGLACFSIVSIKSQPDMLNIQTDTKSG